MDREIIYNVGIGCMFLYNSAIFVMCPFDYNANAYPSICVATKNDKYEVGEMFFLDEKAECDIITHKYLKEIFMKDIDNVMN